MVFPLPAPELLAEGLRRLGFPETDTAPSNFSGGSQFSVEAEGGEQSAVASGLVVRGIATIVPLVDRYLRELELFNAAFDLVGADNRSDLVVRHILDSLAPWKELARALADSSLDRPANSGFRVADAGSGAGFPGIPLAIAFPDISFTPIERMSKRCAFLENCSAILRLKNVKVLNSEVERAPAESFDAVVFRAFRPLDRDMTRTLLRLVAKPDGFLAAWKARAEKIEEEMAGVADEIGGFKVYGLTVPWLEHEERNLVVIRP